MFLEGRVITMKNQGMTTMKPMQFISLQIRMVFGGCMVLVKMSSKKHNSAELDPEHG